MYFTKYLSRWPMVRVAGLFPCWHHLYVCLKLPLSIVVLLSRWFYLEILFTYWPDFIVIRCQNCLNLLFVCRGNWYMMLYLSNLWSGCVTSCLFWKPQLLVLSISSHIWWVVCDELSVMGPWWEPSLILRAQRLKKYSVYNGCINRPKMGARSKA